jgi:hypothetical protein
MGRRRAMVAAEPRPGRMPTMTPRETPAKQTRRLMGWRETEKPRAMFESACIVLALRGGRWEPSNTSL